MVKGVRDCVFVGCWVLGVGCWFCVYDGVDLGGSEWYGMLMI